jgi:hypothetical protein
MVQARDPERALGMDPGGAQLLPLGMRQLLARVTVEIGHTPLMVLVVCCTTQLIRELGPWGQGLDLLPIPASWQRYGG